MSLIVRRADEGLGVRRYYGGKANAIRAWCHSCLAPVCLLLAPVCFLSVLETAARAEDTILGKAAKTLARLGRMKFEGCINNAEDELRNSLLECIATLVKLPQGLAQDADSNEIVDLIHELIEYGNVSDVAKQASHILAPFQDSPVIVLDDDSPLAHPLVAYHSRLKNLLKLRREKALGLEFAFDSSKLELAMKAIRAEMSYSEIVECID